MEEHIETELDEILDGIHCLSYGKRLHHADHPAKTKHLRLWISGGSGINYKKPYTFRSTNHVHIPVHAHELFPLGCSFSTLGSNWSNRVNRTQPELGGLRADEAEDVRATVRDRLQHEASR